MNAWFTRTDLPRRWYGPGRIAGDLPKGLLTVGGVPAARKIYLFDRSLQNMVSITTSNPDGTWEFRHLDPARRFTVVALDHNHVYNAVIRDNLIPAVEE